jgi:hypothetical protein
MKRKTLLTVLIGIGLSLIVISSVRGTTTTEGWIQLFPTGAPPAARYSAGRAYDEVNDRLILFSGEDFTGLPRPTDVWVLTNATGIGGTPSWIELPPIGGPPLGREGQTVVYDPISNRIIVHAGCSVNCSPALSDTWILTNANGLGGTPIWIQLPNAPIARSGPSAVYDSGNNRMIVFGGNLAFFGTDQNDVWVLTDANGIGAPSWVRLFPTGTPPSPRESAEAVYDPTTNRMIVFGGAQFPNLFTSIEFNDVWVLTNANGLGGTPQWSQLTPVGTPPSGRTGHSLAYDPSSNRMTLFGGVFDARPNPPTLFSDVWILTEANGTGSSPQWIQLTPAGGPPVARSGHSVGYSRASNRMVVAMGRNDQATPPLFNDVWVMTNANGAGTPECVPPPSGLVSWWPGDGTANDIAGGNNGTLVNGATFAPGMVGQAFSFDEQDDLVLVPHNSNLDFGDGQDFSIDAWINLQNPTPGIDDWIVSKVDIQNVRTGVSPNLFALLVERNTRRLRLDLHSNTTFFPLSGSAVPIGEWVHVTAVRQGSTGLIYMNGVLDASATLTSGTLANSDPLAIGAVYDTAFNPPVQLGHGFGGLIDELEIFTRALTGSEIQAIFKAGSAGKCKNVAPTAICQNVTVSADPSCTANASIDNGSFDPDSGDTITLTQTPPGPYPLGTTSVTLTVTDNHGASSQCTGTVTVLAPQFTALGLANVWLGLKNSDDVGTKFDLLAEVFKNGSPVGSGQLDGVPGGSSGFNNAVLRTINLALSAPVDVCSGDTLSLRLSVRIAVGVSGHRSGTARLWFNDAQANSRVGATIDGVTSDYFLLNGFTLGAAAGPGPKKTIDVFVDRLVGGNPFKPFGTWSKTF